MSSRPSLKLHVLSDVHVDYRENRIRLAALAEEMATEPGDAFVLAGDLSHKLVQVDETLRQLADLSKNRMFVAGNHDVWLVRPEEGIADSWQKLDALGDLAQRHGYSYLERDDVAVGGFTFVGSIGWYDYSFASPTMSMTSNEYADKRWQDLTYMDRDYAKWGAPDGDVASRLTTALESRLARAAPPVVFVSHHVPLEKLVLRRGVPSWDFFNAYMGSKGLEALLRRHHVERFVFGHTHRPVTLIEPGAFVINNPLGYPRQALNPIRRPFVVT